MAEIEIHHEHRDGEHDPLAPSIGIAVGIIGIILAVVTIASHREHTAAVIHKTEANDEWAFYQAKKIRETSLEVGVSLISVLGGDPAKAQAASSQMMEERNRYMQEAAAIKKQAEGKDAAAEHAEQRAFRFDTGEGLLELGLVLSSLYFLSKKRLFPIFGLTAALTGAVVGGWGFMF